MIIYRPNAESMEYTDADEVSATSPAGDEDFLRAFNAAVDRSVKFDTNVAASFVQKHDFKGLEGYVLDVLTKVHGTCILFHHPGIMCAIYEAQISYLIREELFSEAENVFNDKVKPLIDEYIDELYKPGDLDSRVKVVQDCVNDRKQPTVDEHEDGIVGLLLDYFRLYFPTCSMDEDDPGRRKGSVEDFVVAVTDEKGVRLTRCLACQWAVVAASSSMDQGKLTKHYRGDDIQVKSCSSITKWMLAYLDYLQSSNAGTIEMIQRNPVVKSSSVKKRKSPSPLCGQVVADLIPVCNDVFTAVLLALLGIATGKELDMAAVSKGRDILDRQQKLSRDLLDLFFGYFCKDQDPLNASVAFQKIGDLSNLSEDLVQLSRHLPSCTGVLTDVHLKVADLRKSSLVLAEVTDPKTGFVLTAAGEFTSTSSGEGSQFSDSSSVGSC